MVLAATIQQHAATLCTQQSWITDGHYTCSYQELPDLLAAIDRRLRGMVDPAACLALECSNTLPAALSLICLLQGNYRWMLLPPGGTHEKGAELKPVPAMCQYLLRLNPASSISWPQATMLDLVVNEHYQGEAAASPGAQLYLRTSGSMGVSKIVAHTSGKLLANARSCVERFQLTASDRVAMAVPIFHMYGLGAGFLPALLAGASIDLQEHSHVLRYFERERQFNPTVAYLTPALCAMILERRRNPRPYRVAVSAGARLKEELIRAFAAQSGPLLNLYGSTELGAIAAPAPDDPLELRATTIGRPMAGVRLALAAQLQAATSDGAPAEALTDELYCRHPAGFDAYLDDYGRLMSQAAVWFKTGDLARLDPDGSIRILGRADNRVNRDGYLVLLSDIETALETTAAIAQIVVLVSELEGKRGQRLVAFCSLKPGMALTPEQLRAASFAVLPRYAVPDEIVILPTLPTLPSGKVDRQALRVPRGEPHA